MAYFVFKDSSSPVKASNLIRSTPTYLRCIAVQTRSKYDQPTLYRRPPRCTPAQHTTRGERDHPRPFFNRLKNLSRSPRPLRAGRTNQPCILDQHTLSPIKAPHWPIRLFFQSGESGVWSALWCERTLTYYTFCIKYCMIMVIGVPMTVMTWQAAASLVNWKWLFMLFSI